MSNHYRYFLIADPRTGLVVRRSRMPASIREPMHRSLLVGKEIWKKYRAGDAVSPSDLRLPDQESWRLDRERVVRERSEGAYDPRRWED